VGSVLKITWNLVEIQKLTETRIQRRLAGHFPGFIAGLIVLARRFALHTPHDFSYLCAKQVVLAIFGGSEFFHTIHRAIEALNGFDPQRTADGVVLEDVVRDVIRQYTSPIW
jgi:hypothetical protein